MLGEGLLKDAGLVDPVIPRRVQCPLHQDLRDISQRIRPDWKIDTPEMRRLARLQLQPVDSGRVRFVSDILETEARLAPLTLEYAPHCQPLIRSCSICSHLQYGEEWLPAEIVAEQHLGVMSENSFRVAHAVCDPCLKAVMSMGAGDDARGPRAILGRAWH